MSDVIHVRCATCHRLEAWRPGQEREVLTAGGARRHVGTAEAAAWEVLEASVAAGGPRVVAACPLCGQPMVAEADAALPRLAWRLALPGGDLVVGSDLTITSPGGRLSASEARRHVLAETRPAPWWRRIRPAHALFEAALLTSILGPLSAFVLAVLALSLFMHPAMEEWAKVFGAFR